MMRLEDIMFGFAECTVPLYGRGIRGWGCTAPSLLEKERRMSLKNITFNF